MHTYITAHSRNESLGIKSSVVGINNLARSVGLWQRFIRGHCMEFTSTHTLLCFTNIKHCTSLEHIDTTSGIAKSPLPLHCISLNRQWHHSTQATCMLMFLKALARIDNRKGSTEIVRQLGQYVTLYSRTQDSGLRMTHECNGSGD